MKIYLRDSEKYISIKDLKIVLAALSSQDALRILGVESADPAAIKKAYRDLARINHPDRGGDAETMKKINEAYEVLQETPAEKVDWREKYEKQKEVERVFIKSVISNLSEKLNFKAYEDYFSELTQEQFRSDYAITHSGSLLVFKWTSPSAVFTMRCIPEVQAHGPKLSSSENLDAQLLVSSSFIVGSRKVNLGDFAYKYESNVSFLTEPSKVFPKEKLMDKIDKSQKREISKRDVILFLQSKLGGKDLGKDTFNIPLGNAELQLHRVTMSVQGERASFWSLNFIYSKKKDASFFGSHPPKSFFPIDGVRSKLENDDFLLNMKKLQDISKESTTLQELLDNVAQVFKK